MGNEWKTLNRKTLVLLWIWRGFNDAGGERAAAPLIRE